MLSYRHAFHAGNHADMLKHFVLFLVLNYFNQKDKPYWYVDTHSGVGVYDLRSPEAQKVGEYQTGLGLLQQAQDLPEELQAFRQVLANNVPESHLYGGSPWLAQSLLRADDKMRLFELHPADFQYLQHNMQTAKMAKRVLVKQEDGYQGLIALLPPATRRAVVLIDPPYESKQDYVRVVHTLKEALKRFQQGCYLLWYPCLSRQESKELPEKLKKLLPDRYLHVQLSVQTPRADGFGMYGSGMWILNPPYVLAEQLQRNMPALLAVLRQDAGANFVLDYHIQ